jgi:hypothetical protein
MSDIALILFKVPRGNVRIPTCNEIVILRRSAKAAPMVKSPLTKRSRSSVLVIPRHPSLTPAMESDIAGLVAVPLRNWQRWNRAVGEDAFRSGNCHHAATALVMDLVAASAARGWRAASGFVRFPEISEPVLHSWLESPHEAVVDASQVYKVSYGLAMSRECWFREFRVEPLVQRRPGQIVAAVRRFGLASAALLPITQLLEAAASGLM